MFIPLRILFTGVLFYAAYRFGKSVGKEEERKEIEDKTKSTGK